MFALACGSGTSLFHRTRLRLVRRNSAFFLSSRITYRQFRLADRLPLPERSVTYIARSSFRRDQLNIIYSSEGGGGGEGEVSRCGEGVGGKCGNYTCRPEVTLHLRQTDPRGIAKEKRGGTINADVWYRRCGHYDGDTCKPPAKFPYVAYARISLFSEQFTSQIPLCILSFFFVWSGECNDPELIAPFHPFISGPSVTYL